VATVFDLLGTLPRISLDRLYGLEDLGSASSSCTPSASPFPWTCRAVFQSLTPLAKQYVMRLLCLPEGVRQSSLKSWVEPRFVTGHQKAVQQLDRLRILLSSEDEDIEEDEDDRNGGYGRLGNGKGRPSPRYRLNGHFRKNLQAALTNQLAGPWSMGTALEEKAAPDAALPPLLPSEELETYMCDKWNGVLHYLVGAEGAGFPDPAEEVKQFLADTGMMAVPEEEGEEGEGEGEGDVVLMGVEGTMGKEGKGRRHLRITNAGIDFLLKDVHLQVWRFVAYVIAHEAASRDEILTFLFQLSYCAVGRPYPVRALSPTQQALLEKFISFGLIYQDDRHSRHFYPTAVAVNLIFGGTVQEERLRRGHGHVRPEGRENTKVRVGGCAWRHWASWICGLRKGRRPRTVTFLSSPSHPVTRTSIQARAQPLATSPPLLLIVCLIPFPLLPPFPYRSSAWWIPPNSPSSLRPTTSSLPTPPPLCTWRCCGFLRTFAAAFPTL